MDDKIFQYGAHKAKSAAEKLGAFRYGDPLQPYRSVIALMLIDQGIITGNRITFDKSGQHHNLLTEFRVALMGHGGAADFP